eukprot:TRINITY_DN3495_c0_g1_i8.p1 TRINITY_DN3495_c0_g1~~TRINITY_DN3495_c0_g1_i8.p1  ORF type:complete len:364 (-),score=62.75 TRINITY_DN3495_c0_g1_i8:306-1397(-)
MFKTIFLATLICSIALLNVSRCQYTEEDLKALFKYNFGIMTEKKTTSQNNILNLFEKRQLLHPILMSSLFILQGNQETLPTYLQKQTFSIPNLHSLLDAIYAENDQFSLVNEVKQSFVSNEKFVPFYVYQSDLSTKKQLNGYEIVLKQIDKITYRFYDNSHHIFLGKQFQLNNCLNNNFKSELVIENNYKYIEDEQTKQLLEINDQNRQIVHAFLKDVCSIINLGSVFIKGDYPTFMSFYLTSVKQLQQILTQEQMQIIYKLLQLSIQQYHKNLEKSFTPEENFQIVASVQNDNVEQTRILQESTDSTSVSDDFANESAQIKFWFGFVIVFITFYTCYALFNMKNQRETLLYAKFLTTNQKQL